jgi:hypothetical protein
MKHLFLLLSAVLGATIAQAQQFSVGASAGVMAWHKEASYGIPQKNAVAPVASLFTRWDRRSHWSFETGLEYSSYNSTGPMRYLVVFDGPGDVISQVRNEFRYYGARLQADYRVNPSGRSSFLHSVGISASPSLLWEETRENVYIQATGQPVKDSWQSVNHTRFTVWTGLRYAVQYSLNGKTWLRATVAGEVEPGLLAQRSNAFPDNTPYARFSLSLGIGYRFR